MKPINSLISLALSLLAFSCANASQLPACNKSASPSTWTDCTGKLTSPGIGEYVGEIRNGKPNGLGTITFVDGAKYVGQLKDGKHDGQGTYTWPNGNQYIGKQYVGEFKDGKQNGQGTLVYANGSKYVGEFRDGKPADRGTLTETNKTTTQSQAQVQPNQSQPRQLPACNVSVDRLTWTNCIGTLTYSSGISYAGEFRNGNYYGQGTLTWPSGQRYVGEFKDGNYNGQGTLAYADGDKYVGEFKDDKKHGQGTLTYADGRVYAGEFKNGNQMGWATAPKQSSSGGSGFLGGVLGGVAGGMVDKYANKLDSAAAGIGGVGGAVVGAGAAEIRQTGSQFKADVAKSQGDSLAGNIGNAVGSGAVGGAAAGGIGGSVVSSLAGSRTSAATGAIGTALTGGRASPSGTGALSDAERLASNRAYGAPDNFETYNEKICKQTGYGNYCAAGRTERERGLGGLEKFGKPGGGAAPGNTTVAMEKACQASYQGPTDNPQTDSFCKLAQLNSCLFKATGTATYRTQAGQICSILDATLKSSGNNTAGGYCEYCRGV